MRYFITGSTGFIGFALAKHLAAEGNLVNLLVRSPEKARELQMPGVKIFSGDITEKATVETAMLGCTLVFHLAGYAKPTAVDPDIYRKVNIEGTENVLETALKLGIKRVVFTSTAGTFRPTTALDDVNEESPRPETYHTVYAETKRLAEKCCEDYRQQGLDVIIVYPTRVFGPGVLNESNAVTKIADKFQRGKWRIIPGNGKTQGNYVFIDDIVNGLVLAMQKARPGQNYILGGHNISFEGLFHTIRQASGKKYSLFYAPYPVLWVSAAILSIIEFVLRKPAMISPAWVKNYLQHRRLSSQKAQHELGYTISPLHTGFEKTFDWLRKRLPQ